MEGAYTRCLGMDVFFLPQTEYQRDSGARLRQIIDALGIIQVAAAQIMGTSKHVLRNWLAGDNPIHPWNLYRLCRAKGVDFNFVALGDWSRLPLELAKAMEDAVQAKLAVGGSVAGAQEKV